MFCKITDGSNVSNITLIGDYIPLIHNHCMVAINKDIYIMGGVDTGINSSNLYRITDESNITEIILDPPISPRDNHSMVAIGNDICIYGGYGSDTTSKLYKIDTASYFTGKIADLRLYNYPLTDISTIYDEFFYTIPSLPTDFTITFGDYQTRGYLDMLYTVPDVTTELNIINNSILYNSDYEEGSGLYIDFTKPNLQNVVKVTITNNGTIYGRGGIGQISSSDNRREGKYAITVLNNADNIDREITIKNNGNIYGGGNGGYYTSSIPYDYYYTYTMFTGLVVTKTIVAHIIINEPGSDAQYYNGNTIYGAGAPYILPGYIILHNRPVFTPIWLAHYPGITYTQSAYGDLHIPMTEGQNFNTGNYRIIDLPGNNLVTLI